MLELSNLARSRSI